MAYQQVKTVLERVRGLRQAVCSYAEHHRRNTKDDLLAGVFEVIRQHEQRFSDIVEEYQREADEGMLETWIQYSGAESLPSAPDSFSSSEQLDHKVVLQTLLEAEESLAETLAQAERQPQSPRLQQIFAELKELQDHHLRAIANCATEIDQMRGD